MTTSNPRSSAPGYLNVHIPSRVASQKAPAAECIPRFPALLAAPSAADDLSMSPCWTMVLFTVKRYGADELGVDGGVASMRDLRIAF